MIDVSYKIDLLRTAIVNNTTTTDAHGQFDWKVAGSNPCWNGGRIFFSRVDFLCWLLFRYPFHPRVTTVARKKIPVILPKVQVAGYSWTRIHLTYVAFIEPCFGIGHNLSLICQMTSEDIKHQLIIISWADSLRLYVVLHEWLAFIARFLNIHRSGVLTALAWLVPHETAAVSAQVLCTPYNMSLHAKPHT